LNTLLNIFHGVEVNAAFGIANQVSLAVASFVQNFSTAFSPQITKSYAGNDKVHLNNLIHRGTKFSFYLLFIIAIPVILNLEFILSLWLKQVPEYTADFCKLIIISNLISTFYGTPSTLINATGRIATIQKAQFILCLLTFFIFYVTLKMNFIVTSVGYIYIIFRIIYVSMILYFAHFQTDFSIQDYIKKSFVPCLMVTCLSLPFPMLIANSFTGWQSFFLGNGFFFLICCPVIMYLGIEQSERKVIFKAIRSKISNFQ
jgi:Na+-driven multidrug efflux pump